jgi:hypothetical protein
MMFEAPPSDILPTDVPPGFSIAQGEAGPDFRVERRCDPDGAEIIVCGRRGESPHRLEPLPPSRFESSRDPVIPFGFDLGRGARLGPTVSQVTLPNGFVSQRVMLTFRSRF